MTDAHSTLTVEAGSETFEARARATEGPELDRLDAQRAAAARSSPGTGDGPPG